MMLRSLRKTAAVQWERLDQWSILQDALATRLLDGSEPVCLEVPIAWDFDKKDIMAGDAPWYWNADGGELVSASIMRPSHYAAVGMFTGYANDFAFGPMHVREGTLFAEFLQDLADKDDEDMGMTGGTMYLLWDGTAIVDMTPEDSHEVSLAIVPGSPEVVAELTAAAEGVSEGLDRIIPIALHIQMERLGEDCPCEEDFASDLSFSVAEAMLPQSTPEDVREVIQDMVSRFKASVSGDADIPVENELVA
ncbi:hypothetical protein [Salipiger sp. PrR003]|uniref:hypothetical protein n=1 Tax=Salipiger sp. PrR003 TaxID=2706776 RepID=UPI0013DB0F1B|nr:hypothetical protein [Salipiger sp. PrR003]NDV52763.1 hypothetical protein [Salipiger sp. PrR003]